MKPLHAAMLARQLLQPMLLGQPVDPWRIHRDLLNTDWEADVWAEPDVFRLHQLVVGASGGGKTRYLAAFCIDRIQRGHGITVLDSQKSLINYLLAYCALRWQTTGDDSWLKRVHLLRPSYDRTFSYNPLKFDATGIPAEHQAMAFESWRETVVDRLLHSILRSNTSAELDIMRRLKKWLGHLLTPAATPLPDGRQLSIADVWVLLDVYHPDHHEVYATVKSFLPHRVQQAFAHLHRLQQAKRDQQIDTYLESSENALSEFLRSTTEAIFSRPDLPSLNIKENVRLGHIQLVDTSQTRFRSSDSGSKVGGLLIDGVYHACAELYEEGSAVEHDLVIDEVGDILSESLGRFMETARKYKLSITVAPQSVVGTLQQGDRIDIAPELLNNCKTCVAFQQRSPEDVVLLGRYFALPNRKLQERLEVKDRPDPARDEIITLVNRSIGGMRTVAHTQMRGQLRTVGRGASLSQAFGRALGLMQTTANGRSVSDNWSNSQGTGSSTSIGNGAGDLSGLAPIVLDGQPIFIPTSSHSTHQMESAGNSTFESQARGGGRGQSRMDAFGLTRLLSQMSNWSASWQESDGTSLVDGISYIRGETWSTTLQQQLVQRSREEWHPTGQPRYALDFQDAVHEYLLATLPERYAFLRSRINGCEQTILFRIKDVPDQFHDAAEERLVVDSFIERVYATKDYIFRPEPPDVARARRLAVFLGRNRIGDSGDEEPPVSGHGRFR